MCVCVCVYSWLHGSEKDQSCLISAEHELVIDNLAESITGTSDNPVSRGETSWGGRLWLRADGSQEVGDEAPPQRNWACTFQKVV